MQRDASVLWLYAVASLMFATVSVARCVPDPEASTSRLIASASDMNNPAPDQGWWKQYQK